MASERLNSVVEQLTTGRRERCALLDTPLHHDVTPREFPEFNVLVTLLGGLDARVDIDPDVLINPDISE